MRIVVVRSAMRPAPAPPARRVRAGRLRLLRLALGAEGVREGVHVPVGGDQVRALDARSRIQSLSDGVFGVSFGPKQP